MVDIEEPGKLEESYKELLTSRITEYIMTQFSLRKGLHVFGKDGEVATKK